MIPVDRSTVNVGCCHSFFPKSSVVASKKKILLLLLLGYMSYGLGQSVNIGLIDVDSIVANSRIADSSFFLFERLMRQEELSFRDSFEVFEKEYAQFVLKTETDHTRSAYQKKKVQRLRQLQQRLECMDHLMVGIELLFEEELQFFVSEELRRHTPQVKKEADVALIVTHQPIYHDSDNEKEQSTFQSLNRIFIQVLEGSQTFPVRWRGFQEQLLVKIAALKWNMHEHCFNN